jgi:hypothetical protein
MATTTNYSWSTPDDTALVKDGAAAIRTLGSSIDTTTKALNPSTTLGDITYASATANTNTRLPIGASGRVLTVSGGVPAWVAPAGGAKSFALLGSSALSSTITTISGLSGYDDFLVIVQNATAASGGPDLRWRLNGNTGSVYTAAGSNFLGASTYASLNSASTNRFASSALDVGNANSTTGGAVVASLSIRGGNSSGLKVLAGNSGNLDGGGSGSNNRNWQGFYNDTAVISSISLVTLSSTFSSGTIYVYGAV